MRDFDDDTAAGAALNADLKRLAREYGQVRELANILNLFFF